MVIKRGEIFDAEVILREYAVMQEQLCKSILSIYPHGVEDHLISIPKFGELRLYNERWSFRKHGLGVLFTRLSNGHIFDAHAYMQECPTCIDGWRLLQYCESRGIKTLQFGTIIVDATDERSLSLMLSEICQSSSAIRHYANKAYRWTR